MNKSVIDALAIEKVDQTENQCLNVDINIDLVSMIMPIYEFETPVRNSIQDVIGNEINNQCLTEAGRFREILYGIDSVIRPYAENENIDSINVNLSIPEQENEEIKDALETVVLKGGVSMIVYNEECQCSDNSINNEKVKKKKIDIEPGSETIQVDTDIIPPSVVETSNTLGLLQNEIGAFSSSNKRLWGFDKIKGTPIEDLKVANNGGIYSSKFYGGTKANIKIVGNMGKYKNFATKVGNFGKIGGVVGFLDAPEVAQKLYNADDFQDYGTIVGEKSGEIIGGRVGTAIGTSVGTFIVTSVVAAGVTVSAPVSLLVIGTSIILFTVGGSVGGKAIGGKIGGRTGEFIDSSGMGETIKGGVVEFAKSAGETLDNLPPDFYSGPKW